MARYWTLFTVYFWAGVFFLRRKKMYTGICIYVARSHGQTKQYYYKKTKRQLLEDFVDIV